MFKLEIISFLFYSLNDINPYFFYCLNISNHNIKFIVINPQVVINDIWGGYT